MKAKDEPRNAGTLRLVIKWNSRVPSPANSRVVAMSSPVRMGTRTVAPNIANMCWIPRTSILGVPRVRASYTGPLITVFSFISDCTSLCVVLIYIKGIC